MATSGAVAVGTAGVGTGTAGDGSLRALVEGFSAALLAKLEASASRRADPDEWRGDGWRDALCDELARHVAKGDPLDVAAYAAFAWHHGWSVGEGAGALREALAAARERAVEVAGLREALAEAREELDEARASAERTTAALYASEEQGALYLARIEASGVPPAASPRDPANDDGSGSGT